MPSLALSPSMRSTASFSSTSSRDNPTLGPSLRPCSAPRAPSRRRSALNPAGTSKLLEKAVTAASSSRRSDGDSTWRYLRHSESEDSAARHARRRPELPAMRRDDRSADRQPHAHALGLGREKGFEDADVHR